MKKGKIGRVEVWCTQCWTEGHDKEQCHVVRTYLNIGVPNLFNPTVLYCEICRTTGQHRPEGCHILHRYVQVLKNPYCKFCKSVGHNEDEFHSFDLMRERTYDAYQVQNEGQSNDGYGYSCGASGRGDFGGRGHGGMDRRGRGQVVCYNCNQTWHLARDCRNPTTTCRYCRAVDHVIEQCPQLLAKI